MDERSKSDRSIWSNCVVHLGWPSRCVRWIRRQSGGRFQWS